MGLRYGFDAMSDEMRSMLRAEPGEDWKVLLCTSFCERLSDARYIV